MIDERHWRERTTGTLLASRAAQITCILIMTVSAAVCHWQNDGLWFQGDAPRHAATGFFFMDLLWTLPADPLDFALSYYARYPVISPVAYPPLFYVLEAAGYSVFAASPYVPKVLVLAFSAMAGIYVMAWARRRIAPFAGWSGPCALAMPAFVLYTHTTLLNVPGVALSLAALYHLRAWLDQGGRRQNALFVLFSTASALTYFPTLIILPVATVWSLGSRRTFAATARVVVLAAVMLLGLVAFAWSTIPVYSTLNAPSVARLFGATSWTFYGNALLRIIGPFWLALSGLGLACAATSRRWRFEAFCLSTAYPIVIVCLILLPAYDERYALLLIPIAALSAFLGLAALSEWASRRTAAVAVAGTVVLLCWSLWSGTRTRVPDVSGFRAVAEYLRDHAPTDRVLYSGLYDGVFGFYVRALDPGFQRQLVLTKPLLYHRELDSKFSRVETSRVASAADVIDLIRRKSGCRWIAAEAGLEGDLPVSDRYLREALKDPAFERIRSFPIKGSAISAIDLYRFKEQLEIAAPTVDLEFPVFSQRVFTGIAPIQRR